jgi:hypothetical protein
MTGKIRDSFRLEREVQVDTAPVDVVAGTPDNLFARGTSELANLEIKL